MIPSLEGLPTKAKEAPSPHEGRLAPLDTIPVFQSLDETILSGRNWRVFWMSTGYWLKKQQSNSFSIWFFQFQFENQFLIFKFFNYQIRIILFVCKGRLLILQEIQEVNIKIKEQSHGMMLTTSFFQKEKINSYTLATYIYIRR